MPEDGWSGRPDEQAQVAFVRINLGASNIRCSRLSAHVTHGRAELTLRPQQSTAFSYARRLQPGAMVVNTFRVQLYVWVQLRGEAASAAAAAAQRHQRHWTKYELLWAWPYVFATASRSARGGPPPLARRALTTFGRPRHPGAEGPKNARCLACGELRPHPTPPPPGKG